MKADKVKFWLFTIFDFAFTFGGSAGVIVYNYITPTNTLGYKLTLGGVLLVIALLFTAKAIFEKRFRGKYDELLQALANARTDDDKDAINKAIDKHKIANYVYNRLMILLPFIVLFVVTWLGANALENLHSSVGLVLSSLTAGSVFNILKRAPAERLSLAKITKRNKK